MRGHGCFWTDQHLASVYNLIVVFFNWQIKLIMAIITVLYFLKVTPDFSTECSSIGHFLDFLRLCEPRRDDVIRLRILPQITLANAKVEPR